MNKSRQQYEEWFKKEFDEELAKYGEKLVDFVKGEQFKIWQTSRECLEVELPRKHDEDDEYDYYAIGYNSAIDKIKSILLENGVKVK